MNKHPDYHARYDRRFGPPESSPRDAGTHQQSPRQPGQRRGQGQDEDQRQDEDQDQDRRGSRASFGREGSDQRERFPLREREGIPFASPERFGVRPATRRDFEGDDRFQGREATGISEHDQSPFAVGGDFRPGLGRFVDDGHERFGAPWEPPRTSYHDPRGALQRSARYDQAPGDRLDPDTRFDRNRLGDEPDFARGPATASGWTSRWDRELASASRPSFPHFGDIEHDRLDHRFVPDRGSLGPYVGRGPKGYVRSDERIREELCEMLYLQGYVDTADIEVFVHEGEVTLKGSVRELADKHFVEHLADRVAGVIEVHNELLRQRPNDPERRPREAQTSAASPTSTNVRGASSSKPS